ncbi:tRNA (adenosine(37)-N6)-dimethylallyltransferase MiaA [Brevundimonas vesicularis]|uniref:tRNA (adenosine(37)-N6)-dimethylallyltransferase MiaA n=1 Tax=Brevundimonas vesicularis TaxID=41276 RepID=UPI0015EF7B01|nr:tRNA (adenosine(37)-N6)-dimethylallyltransferase MiaA [Brevundimonas vesicularis]
MSQPPSITLIAGPTASGKSALALKMARETGAVIINADSQQLYADLRVLTARPSVEDEAQADHRLYGIADAADAWSVGRWSRAVMALLDDLRKQGRPAILVGGTGLYFMSLTRGLADIPAVPSAVRGQVEADYAALGEPGFRQRLSQIDAEAAQAIEHGDRQRLVRAMSVFIASGRALSAWKGDTQPLLAPGSWTGWVREPERQQLYASCDQRVDLMIDQGAIAEVQALLDRGLSPALPAMKAVGVRELAAYLSGDLARDDAIAALKQATRNYAKRQLTWFRNQTPDWRRA